MSNPEYTVNNLETTDVGPVVESTQAMETDLQSSGEVIRKNLEDGFQGYLVSAEHLYLRKCDVERQTDSLERYTEWLQTLKLSSRTARRMCAFYLALKVTRTDILATVGILYLRNVSATVLQKVIKLDADKENGVDTGQFLRSEIKHDGIFLYFGPDESSYDLANLSSRQIDSLAFPKSVSPTSDSTVNPGKSSSSGNPDGQAAVESEDGNDDELMKLRLHCEELERTILDLRTELAAYGEMIPKAQHDELKRKFTQHLQHVASEKKKLVAASAGDTGQADVEDVDEMGDDEDGRIGSLDCLDKPGYFDTAESILAA